MLCFVNKGTAAPLQPRGEQPFNGHVAGEIFPRSFFDNNTISHLIEDFDTMCVDVNILAQAMAKALSDCLPGIIVAMQVQSQNVVSSMSH